MFKGFVEFRRPGDGVGALEFEAGENVMKWCLGCCCMGQELPVEVQNAQKFAELTGGFGRVTFLILPGVGNTCNQGR
jgi:hypothetical protein